jgi:ribosome-associated heat shock protein Hsp15
MSEASDRRVRLDAWLWAARFFKTRSQAAAAVKGGKVEVIDARAKASHPVGVGTRIEVRKGPYTFTVTVDGVAAKRGSAEQAQALYTEDEASVRRREETRMRLAAERVTLPQRRTGQGRPTKKERRELMQFQRRRRRGPDD